MDHLNFKISRFSFNIRKLCQVVSPGKFTQPYTTVKCNPERRCHNSQLDLTSARLLQRKGADVKVYERDASKESRVQGAIVIFFN